MEVVRGGESRDADMAMTWRFLRRFQGHIVPHGSCIRTRVTLPCGSCYDLPTRRVARRTIPISQRAKLGRGLSKTVGCCADPRHGGFVLDRCAACSGRCPPCRCSSPSDGAAGPVRSCFSVSTNFEMPTRGTDPYLDDDSHFPMSEADVKEELRAADRATAKIAASC